MDNKKDIIMNMAKIMNLREHAKQLMIPVLKDFTVIQDDNPQTVFIAEKDGYLEQITTDGFIEESIEERIDVIINNTMNYMANSGCIDVDKSFKYFKDYTNDIFNYKIYVCDLIVPVDNEIKVVRQFNAYFIEERMHDFYQVSISSSPISYPNTDLNIDKIDIENDIITKELNNKLISVLTHLKYNE